MKRVIVTGGRQFADAACVDRVLLALHQRHGIAVIIHGDAEGADRLAARWAYRVSVPRLAFAADWARNGRAAGPIRNALMLRESQPDLVVAFPGGRGTADMVARARRAGLPVLTVPANATDLTPVGDVVPGVMDDILERCETYRAAHKESA